MIARWMIVGFILWIIVALVFKFAGDVIFQGQSNLPWVFMVLPLVMLAVTYGLLNVLKVAPTDRAEAASIMAVPGLIIGIYQINSFDNVFPELVGQVPPASFASLMFACYAAVIIAGIVASRLVRVSDKG